MLRLDTALFNALLRQVPSFSICMSCHIISSMPRHLFSLLSCSAYHVFKVAVDSG